MGTRARATRTRHGSGEDTNRDRAYRAIPCSATSPQGQSHVPQAQGHPQHSTARSLRLCRAADADWKRNCCQGHLWVPRVEKSRCPGTHGALEEHTLPCSSPSPPCPFSLNLGKTQASVSPKPPCNIKAHIEKKYKAQHHSPLPLNHSPPRNRLTLTKAGVILLTDQFPINSSKKGVSVEPGNPRSWRKTSRISAERLQLCSPLLLRLQLKSRVDHI